MAIFLAGVLPRHSVTAAWLAGLLAGLLAGAALKAAAEALRTPLALETFYRLRRKLRQRLDFVRACLCQEQTAPGSAQHDPLLQTSEHLQTVFPASGCPIAAFQLRFQRPLFG